MRTRKFLRAFLYAGPLLLWMAAIYASSTHLGRYEQSLALIQAASQRLAPESPPPSDQGELFQINDAARKLAHVFAFGILTLLAVRAIQWGESRLKWQTVTGSFALCVLFAVSDALIRIREPDRHVRLDQFVFNGIGALLVFLLTTGYFGVKYWEDFLWEGRPDP
ncbi:MAG: VanZ family protein [Cytophagales bacterium]|nr:VanZ family protein [Armatimonadota bacterium]